MMYNVSGLRFNLLWFAQVLFLVGGSAAFGADKAGLVDQRCVSREIFFEQFFHVAE